MSPGAAAAVLVAALCAAPRARAADVTAGDPCGDARRAARELRTLRERLDAAAPSEVPQRLDDVLAALPRLESEVRAAGEARTAIPPPAAAPGAPGAPPAAEPGPAPRGAQAAPSAPTHGAASQAKQRLRSLGEREPFRVEDAEPAHDLELHVDARSSARADRPEALAGPAVAWGLSHRLELDASLEGGVRRGNGALRAGAGALALLVDGHGRVPLVSVEGSAHAGAGDRDVRAAVLATERLGSVRVHLNAAWRFRAEEPDRAEVAVGVDRVLADRLLVLADGWADRDVRGETGAGGEVGAAVLLTPSLALQAGIGAGARGGVTLPEAFVAIVAFP